MSRMYKKVKDFFEYIKNYEDDLEPEDRPNWKPTKNEGDDEE